MGRRFQPVRATWQAATPTLLCFRTLRRSCTGWSRRGQLYGGEPADLELLQLAAAEFTAGGIGTEDIAVVSGALDGIERALQAQLRAGDLVAVEDPGFAGLFDLLRALGLALRPVPIDAKGMIPTALAEALDEGATAIVVNPRGQNPTGASLDEARAEALGEGYSTVRPMCWSSRTTTSGRSPGRRG